MLDLRFCGCISGTGKWHQWLGNKFDPAAAAEPWINHGQHQKPTYNNIIGKCPLHEGFCPCKKFFRNADWNLQLRVLEVITYLQLKMHIVEHSRRNWFSDAPEGGRYIFFWNWRGVLHVYTCKILNL